MHTHTHSAPALDGKHDCLHMSTEALQWNGHSFCQRHLSAVVGQSITQRHAAQAAPRREQAREYLSVCMCMRVCVHPYHMGTLGNGVGK